MTRAEIVAGLKSIAEWQTDMAGEDDDGRELFLKDAEVVKAASDLLKADGGRTYYDAAAVERARIREELQARMSFLTWATENERELLAVVADDIAEVCGPTGAGGHEG